MASSVALRLGLQRPRSECAKGRRWSAMLPTVQASLLRARPNPQASCRPGSARTAACWPNSWRCRSGSFSSV